MCGKFTQMASWAQVVEYADLFKATPNDDVRVFTPMRAVGVIHLNEAGDKVITPMTWGFTDRRADGRRTPKHMHARGETVDSKSTWADAFRYRRGIAFAATFNEGEEIPIIDDAGNPTGKTFTRQWTVRRKDGRPVIIGVIYDVFDVGRGNEYEFVQITTPPNEQIAKITDRMLLLLDEDDIELWLGQLRAPIEDVKALIKPRLFNPDEWEIHIEDPSKKPPRPRAPRPKPKDRSKDQPDLF
jgi:putative SOS response-associated peptidase YedK